MHVYKANPVTSSISLNSAQASRTLYATKLEALLVITGIVKTLTVVSSCFVLNGRETMLKKIQIWDTSAPTNVTLATAASRAHAICALPMA